MGHWGENLHVLSWISLRNLFLVVSLVTFIIPTIGLEEGDACHSKEYKGICLPVNKCRTLRDAVDRCRIMHRNSIPSCGLNIFEEVICCLKKKDRCDGCDCFEKIDSLNLGLKRAAEKACEYFNKNYPVATPHIIDGEYAHPGDFPQMAAIAYPGANGMDWDCGGSLIDRRFILTAAHCVYNPEKQPTFVRLGSIRLSKPRDHQDIKIKKIHIHDDYRSFRKYNDIALLELEESAEITLTVKPGCLVTDFNELPSNIQYTVAGWGHTDSNSKKNSDHLMWATLNFAPRSLCQEKFEATPQFSTALNEGIQENLICAGGADKAGTRKDACQGDSGGPLYVNSENSNVMITGVVATGLSCGSSYPGLYTNVTSYLDFIERICWKNTEFDPNAVIDPNNYVPTTESPFFFS